MSKTKKAFVNTVLVALIMVTYQLLIKNLSFLPTEVAINATIAFEHARSIVYLFVLFSLLILIWGKNRYLLEKPLFGKSQPFLKRLNIGKLAVVLVVNFLIIVIRNVIRIILTDFGISYFDCLWAVLCWFVYYIIIVGKGHSIFKNPKYALTSFLIILPITVICSMIVSNIAVQMQVSNETNVFGVLETISYADNIGTVNVVLSSLITATLVFLHTLSVPEEVPLEAVTEEAEATE